MDSINQQPAQSPLQTPVQANMPEHKNKMGPIVAILVIVLVLIIGALYIFASRVNKDVPLNTTTTDQSTTEQNQQVEEVPVVTNQANDTASLESDLNTSIKGLDNQNF